MLLLRKHGRELVKVVSSKHQQFVMRKSNNKLENCQCILQGGFPRLERAAMACFSHEVVLIVQFGRVPGKKTVLVPNIGIVVTWAVLGGWNHLNGIWEEGSCKKL